MATALSDSPPSTAPGVAIEPAAEGRLTRWFPLAVSLLALAPFAPLVWPDDRVLGGKSYDYDSYQVPVRQFVREELLQGRFPLWHPRLACGTPLHAAQQATITYPLLTPLVLLPSVNYGIRLSLFLHLLLGFWGQYLLARRFKVSRGAATFAALVMIWSGFATDHLMVGHVSPVISFTLLPWLFLAGCRLFANPGPLAAAGLAAVASLLLLTGHPQVPYYGLLFGLLWLLGALALGPARGRWKPIVGWGLAAGLAAALIIAVQWVPSAELLTDGKSFSLRGKLGFSFVAVLEFRDLFLLVVPQAFGNEHGGVPTFDGPWWFHHEKACYLGLLTLGLVLFRLTRCRVAAWEWGLLVLCSLALLIALGTNLLFAVIPGLAQFRCPGRAAAVLSVLAPLLAASGFDTLLAGEGRPRRWLLLVLLTLLAGLASLARLRSPESGPYLDWARQHVKGEFLAAGLFGMASIAAVLLTPRLARHSRLLAQGVLLLIVMVDLWTCQVRHFCLREPPPPLGEGLPESQASVRFAPLPGHLDILRYSPLVLLIGDRPWSTVVTNEGGVLPATAERLQRKIADSRTHARFVHLSACNHVFDQKRMVWEPVESPLPRVRLASLLDVEQLQADFAAAGVDVGQGSVEVLSKDPQQMRLTATTSVPTLLIVADCNYPGWQVEVNGRPARVVEVHGIFRGVRLEPGTHEVRFTYVSRSFRVGATACALGLLLLAGLCLAGMWRLRR